MCRRKQRWFIIHFCIVSLYFLDHQYFNWQTFVGWFWLLVPNVRGLLSGIGLQQGSEKGVRFFFGSPLVVSVMLGFFLDKMEEVNSRWNRVFYLSSSISGDWKKVRGGGGEVWCIVNVVRGFVYFFYSHLWRSSCPLFSVPVNQIWNYHLTGFLSPGKLLRFAELIVL